MTPHNGRRHRGQCRRKRADAAELLDVRRAEKNPKETRDERRPRSNQRTERACEQRRESARMIPAAHEADELQNHDERSRCCLGETEAVHHLTWLKPAIGSGRLLRDVGQNRVGAAEGDHRGFAEEETFLEQCGVPALPETDHQQRRPPERNADKCNAQRPVPGGSRVTEK